MIRDDALFNPRLAQRRLYGKVFATLCLIGALIGVVVLATLIYRVLEEGLEYVSIHFLTEMPSTLDPESSGVKSALHGTIWLVALTAMFSIPVGVGAAVYLEEFAPRNRITRFIHTNIANLAGVPSIVYGILGLVIFVRWSHMGRSVLAGALTISLLILPVIIIAAREALSAIPKSIRLAAFALGATRWQTVKSHIIPAAIPGIMTGVILALSRAIGEAAPLVMIGALSYVPFVPEGPMDEFTALPIQIFNWCDQPDPVFHKLAATAIIVLLAVLLTMNAVAVALRGWQQRRSPW
jgi:phosphate transport system permease protein